MKKLTVKALSMALAASCMLGVVGCGTTSNPNGNPNDKDVDESKRQLHIGLFNGALGREFMDKIIEEYETANPDVQVHIDFYKSEYEDGKLLATMADGRQDIYYLDSNTYDTFVADGLLADITDVISTKIYDDKGDFPTNGAVATQSILDTMYDDWKNLYKANDGKYYAIPNWMSTPGIIYDADVFADLGYSDEEGNIPETYTDFISLVEDLKAGGYTPFSFSTMDYITLSSIAYFYADYEGRGDFFLNSTFNGTDSTLGEITPANAWELQKQEGRKAALKFAYDLAHGDKYVSVDTKKGLSHIDAQNEFVMGKTKNSGRVAMLLENSYWEREAKGTIDLMGEQYGAGYGWGERNFKYLLAPKFIGVDGIEDTKNTEMHTVYGATSNSMCCISKNSDAIDLAKDFMQFAQSRRSLALYTIYSGCLRAYNFTMTPEEYNLCTTFTKSLVDLTTRDDVEFVPFSKQNSVTKSQSADFDYSWLFKTEATYSVGGAAAGGATDKASGRSVFNLFSTKGTLTVDDYFKGMEYVWQKDWSNYYKG